MAGAPTELRHVNHVPEAVNAAALVDGFSLSSNHSEARSGHRLRPSQSHAGFSRQPLQYDYAGLSPSQYRAAALSHQRQQQQQQERPLPLLRSNAPEDHQQQQLQRSISASSFVNRDAHPTSRSAWQSYPAPPQHLGREVPHDEADQIQHSRLAAAAQAAGAAAAGAAADGIVQSSPRLTLNSSAASSSRGSQISPIHPLNSPVSRTSASSNEGLDRWLRTSTISPRPPSTLTSESEHDSRDRSRHPESGVAGQVSCQPSASSSFEGYMPGAATTTTTTDPYPQQPQQQQLYHRMGEHWEPMTSTKMTSNPPSVEPLKVGSGTAPRMPSVPRSNAHEQYEHHALPPAQHHYGQPPQQQQYQQSQPQQYHQERQVSSQQYYGEPTTLYSHPAHNGSASAGPSSSSNSVRSYAQEQMSAAAILAAGPQPLPSPAIEFEHGPSLSRSASQHQELPTSASATSGWGPGGSPAGPSASQGPGGVQRTASMASHPVSFAASTKLQQMHPVRMLKQQQAAQHPHIPPQDGPLYGPLGLQSRVFGLSKDLRYPSPESAHLPPTSGGLAGVTAGSVRSPALPPGADREALAAFRAGGGNGSSASLSMSKAIGKAGNGQRFSVEIFAPSFDKRGYPVIAGRAATIKGVVRMPAHEGCDVVLRVSAHTTQGAPAAVWDGIALMPPDSGTDRKIFDVKDLLQPDQGNVRPRPAPPGEEPSTSFPFTDDFVLDMPFEVQLPLGMSTRFVNGEMQKVAVPLPPSFEMSTQTDREERESQRANAAGGSGFFKSSGASVKSKMGMSVASGMSGVSQNVKDAIDKGFGESYRLGCFYTMSVTLIRREAALEDAPGKKSKKAKKPTGPSAEDMLTIPFVFLGEPTSLPMPPSGIPPFISPEVLLEPGKTLGPDWEVHCESSRWAGSVLKQAKRNVDLELHMPASAVLQAPCMWPMLLIIRPNDPRMLPASPSSPRGPSSTGADRVLSWDLSAAGSPTIGSVTSSPNFGLAALGSAQDPYSPGEELSRQLGEMAERKATSGASQSHDDGGYREELSNPVEGSGSNSLVSKIRTSLSLSRKSSNMGLNASQSASALQQHHNTGAGSAGPPTSVSASNTPRRSRVSLASTFVRRRPSTAPSGSGSGTSPAQSTVMGYSRERDPSDLARLVRISLLQTTHCISTGPSDLPKTRRKLVSVADLEEIDVGQLLGVPSSPPPALDGSDGGPIPEDHEPASVVAARAVVDHVRSLGIRVLRASIKVTRDQVPAFRCQGIEVKYAIKVDLLPFSSSSKQSKRPTSGGTAAGNSSGGSTMSDALRAVPSSATLSSSNTGSGRRSFSTFRRSRHQSNASATASYVGSEHGRMPSNTSELPRTPPLPFPHGGGGSGGAQSVASEASTLYRSSSQTSPAGANLSFSAIGAAPSPSGANGGIGAVPCPGPLSFGNLRNHQPTAGSDTRSLYGVAGAPTTTGGTTVFAGEDKDREKKVSKSVGALWVDVRIVRSSLA